MAETRGTVQMGMPYSEREDVFVNWQSESGTGSETAYVQVVIDGTVRLQLSGSIEKKQGADGGWYDVVILTRDKVG